MAAVLWSALAVLFLVCSFPPLDWGWLAFLAPWPWCRLARAVPGRGLFLWGYGAGALSLVLGCRWLACSSVWSLVGMVVFESLYYGGMVVALRALIVRRGWPAAWALPAVWVSLEFGRRHFPLDGFPWLFLGYTQHSWLAVLQVADLGGVFLLGAVLAACAGSMDDALQARHRREKLFRLAPGVLLLLTAWLYGTFRLAEEVPEFAAAPRVLVVQANIPQELKASGIDERDLLLRHLRLSRRGLDAAGGEVDLIVWPETMAPRWSFTRGGEADDVWLDEDPPFQMRHAAQGERDLVERILVPELLAESQAWLLIGVLTIQGDLHRRDLREYNTALMLDAQGRRVGMYDKRFLVPGGEYLPLVGSLPRGLAHRAEDLVRSITGGWLPRLASGENSPVVEGPGRAAAAEGTRLQYGLTICYDITYPMVGREAVMDGAELLVNLSNEGWFPDSAEFAQYTAMAACRAAEVKRAVVRCANTGTSASIDPYGRVEALVGPAGQRHGVAGTLLCEPEVRRDLTLYARLGDWPGWAALASLLSMALLRRPRRDPSAGLPGAGGGARISDDSKASVLPAGRVEE